MVQFRDTLTLDAPKRTKDGYLAVRARAARTGVYDYAGSEVDPDNKHGLRDVAVVKVLRDEAAVFDEASMRSFIGKPITKDHPSEPVTAANWKQHADGVVMGTVRDGQHLAFDLLLMDAKAIDEVEGGNNRELSNGYTSELQFGDFTAPDGTKCQARQDTIFGNHVARVKLGRAGPSCAITDSIALCDANPAALSAFTPPSEKPMKITIGDAKDVDLNDGAAVALAVGALNTSLSDAQAKVGTLTADLATAKTASETKDGEIAALNAKLADAEITPAKLQALADARADVIGKAKILAPNIVTDGKADAEIRKEAVTAKLGDIAKDMADAAIEGAFAALTKDTKVGAGSAVQPLGAPKVIGDSATAIHSARAGWLADKQTAYRGQPTQGAA